MSLTELWLLHSASDVVGVEGAAFFMLRDRDIFANFT